MRDEERLAVERLVRAADEIEYFREETLRSKSVPAALLNRLRQARQNFRKVCGD